MLLGVSTGCGYLAAQEAQPHVRLTRVRLRAGGRTLLCALRVEPSTTYSFFSGKSRDEASSSISCLQSPRRLDGRYSLHRPIKTCSFRSKLSRELHHETKQELLSCSGG